MSAPVVEAATALLTEFAGFDLLAKDGRWFVLSSAELASLARGPSGTLAGRLVASGLLSVEEVSALEVEAARRGHGCRR